MKRNYSDRRKVATRATARRGRKSSNQPPILLNHAITHPNPVPHHRSTKRSDTDSPSHRGRRPRERLFQPTPVKTSSTKEEDKDSFLSTDSAKSGFDAVSPPRSGSGGPHRCKICGCGFDRPNLLKSHLIEHGNERAFPCFLCGIRFTTKWNLMKHQKCRSHRAAQSRESDHPGRETKMNSIIPFKKRKIDWNDEDDHIRSNVSVTSGDREDRVKTAPTASANGGSGHHRSTQSIRINVIPFTSPIATQLQLEKLHELDRTTRPTATVTGTLTLDLPLTDPIQLAVSLTYQDVKRCITGVRSKGVGRPNGFDHVIQATVHDSDEPGNHTSIIKPNSHPVSPLNSNLANNRDVRVSSPAPSVDAGEEELKKRSQEELQAARTILFLAHSGDPHEQTPSDNTVSTDTKPNDIGYRTDRSFVSYNPANDCDSHDEDDVRQAILSNATDESGLASLSKSSVHMAHDVASDSASLPLPPTTSEDSIAGPLISLPNSPIQSYIEVGLEQQIRPGARTSSGMIRPPPKKRLFVQYQGCEQAASSMEKTDSKQAVAVPTTSPIKSVCAASSTNSASNYVTVLPMTPNLSPHTMPELPLNKTALDTSHPGFWSSVQLANFCMQPPPNVVLPLASSGSVVSSFFPNLSTVTTVSPSLASVSPMVPPMAQPLNQGVFILPQFMVLPRFVSSCVPMVSSQPMVSPSCFVVQPEPAPPTVRLGLSTSTVTNSLVTPIPAPGLVTPPPKPLKTIAPAICPTLDSAPTVSSDSGSQTKPFIKRTASSPFGEVEKEGVLTTCSTVLASPSFTPGGWIHVSSHGCESPISTESTSIIHSPTPTPPPAAASVSASTSSASILVPSDPNSATTTTVTDPPTATSSPTKTTMITTTPSDMSEPTQTTNLMPASSTIEQPTSSLIGTIAFGPAVTDSINNSNNNSQIIINNKPVNRHVPLYRPLLSKTCSNLQRATDAYRIGMVTTATATAPSLPFSRLVAQRSKYRCFECGMMCHKPCLLRKHYRTHSNVRPYVCQHCDVSFKTRGNLSKHMKSRIHRNRCIQELGFVQAPLIVDDTTQVDHQALEHQRLIVLRKDHHPHHHNHLPIKREIRETRFRAIRACPTTVVSHSTVPSITAAVSNVVGPSTGPGSHTEQQSSLSGVLRKSTAGRRKKATTTKQPQQQVSGSSLGRLVNLQPRPIGGSLIDPAHRMPAPNVNAVNLLQDFPLNLSVRPTQPTVLLRYATDAQVSSPLVRPSSSSPSACPSLISSSSSSLSSSLPAAPTVTTGSAPSIKWSVDKMDDSSPSATGAVSTEAMIRTAIAAARNLNSDRTSPVVRTGKSISPKEPIQISAIKVNSQKISSEITDLTQGQLKQTVIGERIGLNTSTSNCLKSNMKDSEIHRTEAIQVKAEASSSRSQSPTAPSSYVDLDEINLKREQDQVTVLSHTHSPSPCPSTSSSSTSPSPPSHDNPLVSGLPIVSRKFQTEQHTGTVQRSKQHDDPRPYKCTVCNIGFRVTGHLHKHYRSKSHLMMVLQSEHLPVDSVDCVRQSRTSTSQIVNPENGQLRPRASERVMAIWRQTHHHNNDDGTPSSNITSPSPVLSPESG